MNDKILAPWKIGPYDPRYVFDKNGDVVAFASSRYENVIPQARLVAAAPDLLEALYSLVDLLAVGDGSKEHQQYEPPEMKAARAAIAKAEGK